MARPKNVEVVNRNQDVKESEVTMAVEKKTFKDSDLIPCMSVIVGSLFMEGDRSKEMYHWQYAGDVIDVEYRDLISAVRRRDKAVYQPRFIIQDDDFLADHGDIVLMYANLYNPSDYRKILSLSPDAMRDAINKMPEGAKKSLKNFAIQAIGDGTLDSIQRVKVIDEIYGTQLLLKLSN